MAKTPKRPKRDPPPEGWPPPKPRRAAPPPDEMRCNGKSRQHGDRCHNHKRPGYATCRHHGGHDGPTNNIKHGRYSKYLGPLAAKYKDALNDSTLLDLKEPIAVLDAIVRRLAERSADLDTPELRKRAWDLYQAVRTATTRGDTHAAAEAMTDLGSLLRDGASEAEALEGLRKAVDTLSERVEGLWKIKLAKSNALNMAEVKVLVARILDIVSSVTGDSQKALEVGRRLAVEMASTRVGDDGPDAVLLGRN